MKKKFGALSVIPLFAFALTFVSCKKKEEAPPPPPASDAKPDTPAPNKAPSTKGGSEG